MKPVIPAIALALIAGAAAAQSRPSTVDMTCGASRLAVAQRGAVVLGTGGYTYDRFVRDPGFCQVGEFVEPAWVQSRDARSCFIGYRCKVDSPFGDN